MKLFGNRLSPFVDKVASALELKGLAFETVDVKSPRDLRKWNPVTGKIPVLELDDGERVWDSTFILRRVDELFPEPGLLSTDRATAAAQRQLEDWADESLYWYVMSYRWSPTNAEQSLREILTGVPAMMRALAGPYVRRMIAKATRAQGLGRLPEDVLLRELEARLDDLDILLGDDQWLVGAQRPSVADLAIAGELRFLGVSEQGRGLVAARPGLAKLERRVKEACERKG
ncbi:MAG TPA: glutathione S-transferase family protein [Thermoanaerobaculia bacterium]|nr:glutathione S-transferase family protein [Thermoanaerobaculia bacterium]